MNREEMLAAIQQIDCTVAILQKNKKELQEKLNTPTEFNVGQIFVTKQGNPFILASVRGHGHLVNLHTGHVKGVRPVSVYCGTVKSLPTEFPQDFDLTKHYKLTIQEVD